MGNRGVEGDVGLGVGGVSYGPWGEGDSPVAPEHPDGALEGEELLLLADPEDVPEVDGEVDLKRCVGAVRSGRIGGGLVDVVARFEADQVVRALVAGLGVDGGREKE